MKLLSVLYLVGACASANSAPQRESSPLAAKPAPPRDAALLPVDAEVEPRNAVAQPLPGPDTSTSVGSPSNGSLQGGLALPTDRPSFHFNERRDSQARFATVEVIATIAQAAERVRTQFADSVLTVNDLSLRAGGRIAHHGSHRAGRDADILFYLRSDDGQPTESVGAPIDPDGIGFDFKELSRGDDDVRVHFDAARTWLFVASLLENPAAPVQRIFVAEHLRAKLLSAATEASASPRTIALFADISCQPSYPHDDHLHVRWFCSHQDLGQGCEDLPPLYPWREAELRAAGVSPVLAAKSRSVDPAPVTTHEQAAQNVKRQKPHPLVVAFLARRKAWQKQPHPGRKYCR